MTTVPLYRIMLCKDGEVVAESYHTEGSPGITWGHARGLWAGSHGYPRARQFAEGASTYSILVQA